MKLLRTLHRYRPLAIGSAPLGIDVPMSDLDVACTSTNLVEFSDFAFDQFGLYPGFAADYVDVSGQRAMCVVFAAHGWEIELLCQPIPIGEQWGVRHFLVQQRLLNIDPRLRRGVRHLKKLGISTQSAFAQILGLPGDPYDAVAALASTSDVDLITLTTERLRTARDAL
ncbi:MAG: DUF4269 domain-containing protein [Gammaproteobacteria bacterium]|nr:DUF4269 domain-containing protein [Gammaproteobacteria bacterium]